MSQLPKVAPHDSCIACFKGNTTTAVAFEGSAEAHIALLWNVGIPSDQAQATVLAHCEEDLG